MSERFSHWRGPGSTSDGERQEFTPGEVSAYYAGRVPHLKQRRAAEWRGPCPIHQGKNDNFAVEPNSGRWFCFSKCGRGGDILSLERALTGADFRTALEAVYAIVGRPAPARARMTREDWLAVQQARERRLQDRVDALHFANAAIILAEALLEQMDSCDEGRRAPTKLIADLREDACAVYFECRTHDPKMTAALVRTGRARERRLGWMIAGYFAAAETSDAA
jgi:hypothetical protein